MMDYVYECKSARQLVQLKGVRLWAYRPLILLAATAGAR
jgi:hypothetical protein